MTAFRLINDWRVVTICQSNKSISPHFYYHFIYILCLFFTRFFASWPTGMCILLLVRSLRNYLFFLNFIILFFYKTMLSLFSCFYIICDLPLIFSYSTVNYSLEMLSFLSLRHPLNSHPSLHFLFFFISLYHFPSIFFSFKFQPWVNGLKASCFFPKYAKETNFLDLSLSTLGYKSKGFIFHKTSWENESSGPAHKLFVFHNCIH